MSFAANLEVGQLGESAISRWLRGRGWHILPAYEKEIGTGKGPRLFMATGGPSEELITPDLLAMRGGQFFWVEAKHKSVFSWYGKGHYWTTGVDRRHFADYLQVQERTDIPVWLMFLHRQSAPWPQDLQRWTDCPRTCPTGLFGEQLATLAQSKSHESDRHGRSGMVYWNVATLKRLSSIEAITPLPAIAHDHSPLFLR